jgi:hypothetical protein
VAQFDRVKEILARLYSGFRREANNVASGFEELAQFAGEKGILRSMRGINGEQASV